MKKIIKHASPTMTDHDARKLLNNFLFSKPNEVYKKVNNLSGGEKARLSLAQIAVASYRILLLDEISNNIDLETRAHIIGVLCEYPGAMIIVTHDPVFLKELKVTTIYKIEDGLLRAYTYE